MLSHSLAIGYHGCDLTLAERIVAGEVQQPFDTARGFFLEGRELYPTAGFRELDHIQICVRSSKQIIGYFLPRGHVNGSPIRLARSQVKKRRPAV